MSKMAVSFIKTGCGCIKGIFSGCFVIVLFLFGLGFVFSLLEDFDLPFTVTEKEYHIPHQATDNEDYVESSFTWKYVDNSLERIKPTLHLRILRKDIESALRYMENLSSNAPHQKEFEGINWNGDSVAAASEYWRRVYRSVYRKSIPYLRNLTKGINDVLEKENMPPGEKLIFLVTFIQNIEYQIPEITSYGFLPPPASLAFKYGDCDTKALLLYGILEALNIDCVMYWSLEYRHAMLGVAANATGSAKMYDGKRFYFVETTYPGWDIGQLPPEVSNTDYWFIHDLQR